MDFFSWILDSIFGHGHYVWSDLAIPNRVPMPNEPHELTLCFTKENLVSRLLGAICLGDAISMDISLTNNESNGTL